MDRAHQSGEVAEEKVVLILEELKVKRELVGIVKKRKLAFLDMQSETRDAP